LTLKSSLFSKVSFKKFSLYFERSCPDIDPSRWQLVYLAKLKACRDHIADFSDSKNDVDLKDIKKECLIELIDLLDSQDAPEYIMNE